MCCVFLDFSCRTDTQTFSSRNIPLEAVFVFSCLYRLRRSVGHRRWPWNVVQPPRWSPRTRWVLVDATVLLMEAQEAVVWQVSRLQLSPRHLTRSHPRSVYAHTRRTLCCRRVSNGFSNLFLPEQRTPKYKLASSRMGALNSYPNFNI